MLRRGEVEILSLLINGNVDELPVLLLTPTLRQVGSGTDPLEGAALARAVLDRLAQQAGLTLATTHHAGEY